MYPIFDWDPPSPKQIVEITLPPDTNWRWAYRYYAEWHPYIAQWVEDNIIGDSRIECVEKTCQILYLVEESDNLAFKLRWM